MADTDVVFQGLYYAIGYLVSVSVCGLDCGDYTVDDHGQVTVPINSDENQLFNGTDLAQYDVGPYDRVTYGDATTRIDWATGTGAVQSMYLPVVIGFTYPSYGAILRALGEDQIKSAQGPGLGKTRRNHYVAALLRNTQGITFGTENGQWDQRPLTDAAENPLNMNTLFSGVWAQPLDDNDSLNGIVGWNVTRPYACTVVALAGHAETSER
jgi:hypothetical protein